MRARALLVAAAGLLALAGPAAALDHKNLDEGRPLRLEDAYAIGTGDRSLSGPVLQFVRRVSGQHAH